MREAVPEPIVITGVGLACGLGADAETAWQNVLAARRGIGPMPAMESTLPPDSDGGQAVDLPADFSPDLPRESRYLRWAITQAMADADRRVGESASRERPGTDTNSSRLADSPTRRPQDAPARRTSILLGTTLHGMRAGGRFLRSNNFDELKHFLAGDVLAEAVAGLPISGTRATTCSACSSGLGAVALAVTLLRAGEADSVIAGGYDPVSEYAWAGFNALRLVSGPPLRPFARGRVGMKIAEAYAALVLERESDAIRRNATILATVAGYGESADAHHLTQPHPAGTGASFAMKQAIARAGLTTNDIGLAAAHATGTPDNDAAEAAALAATFGDRLPDVPVVAFKSHLGHTLGGAGAIELIFSALALRDGLLPPTVLDPGELVEYDHVRLTSAPAKPAIITATLNTSLGFGGANTSVVLTKARRVGESASRERPGFEANASRLADSPTRRIPVVITGVGLILPGVYDRGQITAPPAGPLDMARVEATLNARRVRRMSDYVKLTLAAVAMAARDAFGDSGAPKDTAAVLGTTHGSANFCEAYYRQLIAEGATAANPLLFAEGVPNAAAAQLSLMLGLVGPCQTILGTATAGLDALRLAALRVAAGEWDRAIVSAGEENSRVVSEAYSRCGHGPADDTAGAAAVVIESLESATARGARVLATLTDTASAGDANPVRALTAALRATPAADRVVGDRTAEVAARQAERGDPIDPWPSGIGGRFSVTPLAALITAIATGDSGSVAVAAVNASGTGTVVRAET